MYAAPCVWQDRAGLAPLKQSVWFPDGLAPASPEGFRVCSDADCEERLQPALLNWQDHYRYLDHLMWCCPPGATYGFECSYPF